MESEPLVLLPAVEAEELPQPEEVAEEAAQRLLEVVVQARPEEAVEVGLHLQVVEAEVELLPPEAEVVQRPLAVAEEQVELLLL